MGPKTVFQNQVIYHFIILHKIILEATVPDMKIYFFNFIIYPED
jgi:hypothetical protein